MSDLRDLPDLAGDVRERVVTPPYDAVSRRVRHRRPAGGRQRRRGGARRRRDRCLAERRHHGRPVSAAAGRPPSPIPPTDESQWRAVVNGTNAGPFEVSGTDDGSVAIVWRALEQPEPTFALVIREADGSVHGRRLDVPVTLTPVPGGWVGLETARGWLIASDGSWTDLGAAREPRPPRRETSPSSASSAGGSTDPTNALVDAVVRRPVDGAYLAPDGTR